MDLNDLDVRKAADEGADLQLEHPVTGEPLDVTIRLLGSDSAAYRNAVKRIAERRRGQKRQTLDEMEQQAAELMASITVGWANLERDGKPVDFSHDAAQQVYIDFPWIREQVDQFVTDRANFFTRPSRT